MELKPEDRAADPIDLVRVDAATVGALEARFLEIGGAAATARQHVRALLHAVDSPSQRRLLRVVLSCVCEVVDLAHGAVETARTPDGVVDDRTEVRHGSR
jgi:hypothetical protein